MLRLLYLLNRRAIFYPTMTRIRRDTACWTCGQAKYGMTHVASSDLVCTIFNSFSGQLFILQKGKIVNSESQLVAANRNVRRYVENT